VPAQATRWGWHRLDSRWAQQFVDRSQVAPGDLVLDIGAGDGALTGLLLATGATVVAFELHPDRAAALRRRFAGQRLTVVRADASDLRLPRRPFKVVSNPPFAITTALLRRLLQPASRLERADLVLPRWATMRWAAGRGVGGISSRSTFHLEVGMRVPPRAFHPPPPDPAAVLTAIRRTGSRPSRRG
jgi:23S rRNA (adenine-N6)-dimethyltransferase